MERPGRARVERTWNPCRRALRAALGLEPRPAYAQRIVGGARGRTEDQRLPLEEPRHDLEVALAAALLRLRRILGSSVPARTRVLVPLLVAASVGLFLVIGYRRWYPFGVGFTWPHGTSNANQAHYMVTPTLLLLSALFLQLDARPRRVALGGVEQVTCQVASWWCSSTALISFEVGDVTNRGAPTWSEHSMRHVCSAPASISIARACRSHHISCPVRFRLRFHVAS